MKIAIVIAFGIVSLVQICDAIYAQDLTCKQALSDLTKRQLKSIGECTKKFNFKSGKEKSERKACVMKCVLQSLGTLDDAGGPDAIGTMIFVEKNFPNAVHEWVRGVIMSCFEFIEGIDPEETSCKSYDPMIKCGMDKLNVFCAGPGGSK